MHVRARSLRTALLATMLVPAIAVPAAAALSAPAAGAAAGAPTVLIAAAPAKASQVKQRSYRLRSAKGSSSGLVEGTASARMQGKVAVVRVQGRVQHVGKGHSLVTVRQQLGRKVMVRNVRLTAGSRSFNLQQQFAAQASRTITITVTVTTCDAMGRCTTTTETRTITL